MKKRRKISKGHSNSKLKSKNVENKMSKSLQVIENNKKHKTNHRKKTQQKQTNIED